MLHQLKLCGLDGRQAGKQAGVLKGRLALGQAVLDDLPGLGRYPVGEEHLELHHQVPALGGRLVVGQPLASQPADGARFDDVAARQRHHPVVEGGDVHRASAQSLEKRTRQKERKRKIRQLSRHVMYLRTSGFITHPLADPTLKLHLEKVLSNRPIISEELFSRYITESIYGAATPIRVFSSVMQGSYIVLQML